MRNSSTRCHFLWRQYILHTSFAHRAQTLHCCEEQVVYYYRYTPIQIPRRSTICISPVSHRFSESQLTALKNRVLMRLTGQTFLISSSSIMQLTAHPCFHAKSCFFLTHKVIHSLQPLPIVRPILWIWI